ncbi:hypothetical protein ACHAW6_006378 [Cyclotella cf. meneghiniana]
MSELRPPAKADDIESSAASTVPNEGESQARVSQADRYQGVLRQLKNTPKFTAKWFRLKEEQMQLRSDLAFEVPSCNGTFLASITEGELGDVHVDEAAVDESALSHRDQREIKTSRDGTSPSTGEFCHDSIDIQRTAECDTGDRQDRVLNEIVSDLSDAFSTGLTANQTHSPNANTRAEWMLTSGRLKPPPRNGSCSEYFKCEFGPENFFGAIESHDETSPSTFSLHNHMFKDGPTSKQKSRIEALGSIHDEGPPVPFSFSFGDAPITNTLSGVTVAKGVKFEKSARSALRPAVPEPESPSPPGAETATTTDFPNQDQAFQNPEFVRRSRSMPTAVDINFGVHSSEPIIQRTSNLPLALTNAIPQSTLNEHFQEEEKEEDVILIPEAFLVEANAPEHVPFAEVAELVDLDHSRVSLKKRHVCVLVVFIAAIGIALGTGLSVKFLGGNVATNADDVQSNRTKQNESRSFLPSSQPSFPQPLSQPSLSIENQIESNVLQRNVTFDGDRLLALDWITNKDSLQLDASDSNLYQRYILALLSYGFSMTDASSNHGVSWRSAMNECEWLGVECDNNNHVKKLDLCKFISWNECIFVSFCLPLSMCIIHCILARASLIGTIPPEIGKLAYLENLTLSFNDIRGTLPPELGKLTFLTNLDIGYNQIGGTLPTELGNLLELSWLLLWDNELTGSIPSELRNLNSLQVLALAINQLNGTIPSWIGVSSAPMVSLLIDRNELTGTLPSEIGNLSFLRYLDLNTNFLRGTLPSEIGRLASLTYLDVNDNLLTGTIPSSIGNLYYVTKLALNSNLLVGTIPSEIRNLVQLKELWLWGNKLTGTLPSEIGYLTSLYAFSVGPNRLNGTIPTEFGYLKDLSHLSLGGNNFTGTIPSELGQLSNLTVLLMEGNHFTGQFPPLMRTCSTGLISLCFNNDHLTGDIPSECDCSQWTP